MKKNEQVLLDTYSLDHLNYEAYLDWCELNECEPAPNESNEYWDWYNSEINNEVDDFFTNLKYSIYDAPCVVTGSIGRWNGTFEIKETRCVSLSNAIASCWSGCDDVIVTKRHSVIYVVALHHDGRCNFEIRLLSDLGEDRWSNNGRVNMNDRKNFLTLPKYLW